MVLFIAGNGTLLLLKNANHCRRNQDIAVKVLKVWNLRALCNFLLESRRGIYLARISQRNQNVRIIKMPTGTMPILSKCQY